MLLMDVFSSSNLPMLLLTAHLFGVVIGAGAAYVSDFIFLSSVRDRTITRTEIRFIKLASKLVWTGLVIIVCSGIGIFLQDPEYYLQSNKFLAKMTIVGIIIINGIVFHVSHIPRIVRNAGTFLPSSPDFMKKSSLLLISGAISSISWTSALLLGATRSLPYSYATIMGIYFVIVFGAICTVLILKKFLFSPKNF